MIEVLLTYFEMRQAAHVGVERQLEAIRHGRNDRHGFSGDGFAVHIDGALAELAVAKGLGSYWEAVVDVPQDLPGDVGDRQVRSTTRKSGCLIVHPNDPDEARFALVIASPPKYQLVGWLHGHEAKQQQWWRTDTGRPAFFVPQSALRPINRVRPSP